MINQSSAFGIVLVIDLYGNYIAIIPKIGFRFAGVLVVGEILKILWIRFGSLLFNCHFLICSC